jgi:hypothetical protein
MHMNTAPELLATLLAKLGESKRKVFASVEFADGTSPDKRAVLDIPLTTGPTEASQAFDAAPAADEAFGSRRC